MNMNMIIDHGIFKICLDYKQCSHYLLNYYLSDLIIISKMTYMIIKKQYF
jgi:hypothetical protein